MSAGDDSTQFQFDCPHRGTGIQATFREASIQIPCPASGRSVRAPARAPDERDEVADSGARDALVLWEKTYTDSTLIAGDLQAPGAAGPSPPGRDMARRDPHTDQRAA